MSKARLNQLDEQIMRIEVERKQVALDIKREELSQDKNKLTKAQIVTQITGVEVGTERLKLSQAYVTQSAAAVSLGTAKDNLSFAQAKQEIGQLSMMAQLQLENLKIADLREQIRHQSVMSGTSPQSTGKLPGFSR